MTLFVLAAAVLVLVAAVSAAGANAEQKRLAGWQQAARRLGLRFTGDEENCCIEGHLKGVPVRLERKRQVGSTGKMPVVSSNVRVEAGAGGSIPRNLYAHRDSAVLALGRMVYGRDDEIGDEAFDDLVALPGMDAFVCAALSLEARRQLAALIKMGGAVREGVVFWEDTSLEAEDNDAVAPVLESFARIAALLSVPRTSLCERLAENALNDPSPAVRLKNFAFLSEATTQAPREQVKTTAVALLSDAHAPLRLLAARQLGQLGSTALLALASDAELGVALRVEALRRLHEIGAHGLDARLASWLPGEPPEVTLCALSIITERRLVAHSAAVLECTQSEHQQVRACAALTLGVLAPEGAEATLIRLLQDSADEVQLASAQALAQIGSLKAVEPLLKLAGRFGNSELRQAARAAIGRIQSARAHVGAGALSLADDQSLVGAVRVVDVAEAGEVSLVEDEDELARAGRAQPSCGATGVSRRS
ncbi:MAG TPA: HEAT repeat domain-containing protein [Polyangiaceae bacterium]|nr:HEAT repeat domain-containing protein [Polyangiaceae bacterium]